MSSFGAYLLGINYFQMRLMHFYDPRQYYYICAYFWYRQIYIVSLSLSTMSINNIRVFFLCGMQIEKKVK